MRAALGGIGRDPDVRSVLLAHQFVTGAASSDSEDVSVGGSENVDASVFDGFDYVALGHLHSPQSVGSDRIRYCGSPLKYSFSEAEQEKSVSVVELGAKGELSVKRVPLVPLRDLRCIRGTFRQLTGEGAVPSEDYLRVILTDEQEDYNKLFAANGNQQESDKGTVATTSIEIGQTVKVVSGPFVDFDGTVAEVMPEAGKVRVMVSIFGRETPVELSFDQVAKV